MVITAEVFVDTEIHLDFSYVICSLWAEAVYLNFGCIYGKMKIAVLTLTRFLQVLSDTMLIMLNSSLLKVVKSNQRLICYRIFLSKKM